MWGRCVIVWVKCWGGRIHGRRGESKQGGFGITKGMRNRGVGDASGSRSSGRSSEWRPWMRRCLEKDGGEGRLSAALVMMDVKCLLWVQIFFFGGWNFLKSLSWVLARYFLVQGILFLLLHDWFQASSVCLFLPTVLRHNEGLSRLGGGGGAAWRTPIAKFGQVLITWPTWNGEGDWLMHIWARVDLCLTVMNTMLRICAMVIKLLLFLILKLSISTPDWKWWFFLFVHEGWGFRKALINWKLRTK